MPARDACWIRDHSGPMTPRRMAGVLTRIARDLGRTSEDLAVTKVAKRSDPFQVLVACLISLRTKDEVTDVAAHRLLAVAPDLAALACLPEDRNARLIYPAGFYRTKARTLHELGRTLVERYGGNVPDNLDELLSLNRKVCTPLSPHCSRCTVRSGCERTGVKRTR
ncbi:MAG: hypothetical protein AB1486_03685 [Planctomycetota bacterium]